MDFGKDIEKSWDLSDMSKIIDLELRARICDFFADYAHVIDDDYLEAVSYTHLTLPTICSV